MGAKVVDAGVYAYTKLRDIPIGDWFLIGDGGRLFLRTSVVGGTKGISVGPGGDIREEPLGGDGCIVTPVDVTITYWRKG